MPPAPGSPSCQAATVLHPGPTLWHVSPHRLHDGPVARAPSAPCRRLERRQPAALPPHCTYIKPRAGPFWSEPEFGGIPRPQRELFGGPCGATYLYPLVRGPKIQNKTMLDEPEREKAKLVTTPRSHGVPTRMPTGAAGSQGGSWCYAQARAWRGASRQAKGHAGTGLHGGHVLATGQAGRATLTELLQL